MSTAGYRRPGDAQAGMGATWLLFPSPLEVDMASRGSGLVPPINCLGPDVRGLWNHGPQTLEVGVSTLSEDRLSAWAGSWQGIRGKAVGPQLGGTNGSAWAQRRCHAPALLWADHAEDGPLSNELPHSAGRLVGC